MAKINLLSFLQSTPAASAGEELAATLVQQGHSIYAGENGKKLIEFLNKIVQPEDRKIVYNQIGEASRLAKNIARERGVEATSSTDPLALIRLLVELRTENMPVMADYKPESGPPAFHPKDKLQVRPEIILAAVLYSAFPFNRQSGEINLDDAVSIPGHLNKIKGLLQDDEREAHVLRILRDALMASEINLGGEVSRAYQEIDGRGPDDKEAAAYEARRIESFLAIFQSLGICPEALLLRSATNSLRIDDIIANPQAYSKREIEQAAKSLEDVYIPMVARARHQAYHEGDVSTANLLNILKTKFKNQRLRLIAPKEYELTRQAIIGHIGDIVPEDKRAHIGDMSAARSFAFKAIGGIILPFFPNRIRQNLEITVRLKDIGSVYSEIHKIHADLLKKGDPDAVTAPHLSYSNLLRAYFPRINDLFGFRFTVLGAENGRQAVVEAYKAFGRKPKASRDKEKKEKEVVPVEGRMKDLYNEKTKGEFLAVRGREWTDYEALHDTVIVTVNGKPVRVELQFVDEAANDRNTYDEKAAHEGYKGQMKAGNGGNRNYIPVFTDINAILRVPAGGNVADAIAETYGHSRIDPYRVFAVKQVHMHRTLHLYNPSIKAPTPEKPLEGESERAVMFRRFSDPVVANDKVLLWEQDPELIDKPEHRKLLIAACATDQSRKLLEGLDAELSGEIEPLNRAERPPGSDNGAGKPALHLA